jgi:cell division transport system permease protein
MRFSFFLREALRGLRRSSAPALAALLTVVITALVLGVFIPIVQATTGTANEVRNRVVVDAYLKDSATESDRIRVQRELEATPGVKSIEYISKDEALRELGQKVNDAKDKVELLGSNPLPSLLRVTPEDPDEIKTIAAQIAPGGTPRFDAIDEVRNRESDTDKILSATGLVKGLGAVMAGLLILASIALIANTIRLSVFARRREVEVMKLVGATNWFIRWPFVLEGLIVGLCGAGLAVGILWAGKLAIVDPLAQNFNLIDNFSTIGFVPLIATLMAAAVVVSALGSGVTLRRFLRV